MAKLLPQRNQNFVWRRRNCTGHANRIFSVLVGARNSRAKQSLCCKLTEIKICLHAIRVFSVALPANLEIGINWCNNGKTVFINSRGSLVQRTIFFFSRKSAKQAKRSAWVGVSILIFYVRNLSNAKSTSQFETGHTWKHVPLASLQSVEDSFRTVLKTALKLLHGGKPPCTIMGRWNMIFSCELDCWTCK